MQDLDIMDLVRFFGVAGATAAMLGGLVFVHKTLKRTGQGFGARTTKIVGVVLFIPTLLILALTTAFESEVLAALLGTVAGYVLSHGDDGSASKPSAGKGKASRGAQGASAEGNGNASG